MTDHLRALSIELVGLRDAVLTAVGNSSPTKDANETSETWFPLTQILDAIEKLNRSQVDVRFGTVQIEQALARLIEALERRPV